jgi:hypothetical protein
MKNPFDIAPRCVQWAAVILIAVPIFSIVVSFSVTSPERFLAFGGILFVITAIQVAYAVGLLFGMNLVRLLFAVTFCYTATTSILAWLQQGFSSMSLVSSLTALIGPGIALVLVVLPQANRYFAGKRKPEEAVEEKAEKVDARVFAFWPIARIIVLLLLLVVGIPLVRHFRPALENATSMNKAQKSAYAKYQEDLQDLQIVENLRLLTQAQGQYFYEHQGSLTAEYSDLVGPGHFLKQLTATAAGEKYPDSYTSGQDPVATLPDGRIVFFDMQAFKAKRMAPR